MQGLDKSVSLLRSQILTLKMSRHEILRQAAVDDLELPVLASESDASKRKRKRQKRRAGDEDRDEEEEEEEEEEKQAEDVEMEAEGADAGAEPGELAAESRLRFDYSDLDEEFLNPAATPADRERWRGEFLKVLAAHQQELDTMAPNLKAPDNFAQVSDKFNNTKAEWEEKKKQTKIAIERFDTIKEQRLQLFMAAYEHISRAIAATYTHLTASRDFPTGGKAYLSLDSNEEPYLHGLSNRHAHTRVPAPREGAALCSSRFFCFHFLASFLVVFVCRHQVHCDASDEALPRHERAEWR